MNNPASPASAPATPGARPHRRLRLLVAAQALVLLGLAGLAWATDHWGQTIYLRTQPVDPRNLLYGDYVRLYYGITQVKSTLWRGPGNAPAQGQPVWLLLRAGKPVWQPVGLYAQAPSTSTGQVVLQGQAISDGLIEVTGQSRKINPPDWYIAVRYGLERYYLPEGTGRKLEAAARDSAGLLVRVQVAPWGTVRLQAVEPARPGSKNPEPSR